MKIKRTALDKKFSLFIRTRDKFTCQRCSKYKGITKDNGDIVSPGLDCSHYHGRRKASTRFDPDNCDGLCMHCHMHFHENREEYKQWKIHQLGEVLFSRLEARARYHAKLDLVAIKIWLDYEVKKQGDRP